MKKTIVVVLLAFFAGVAADYTVPKSWTRTGAEYAKWATLVFNPLTTNTPTEIRVKLNKMSGDEFVKWTLPEVEALATTNSLGATNVFKSRMLLAFGRTEIVNAYNWALVDGREWALQGPTNIVEP